VVTQKNDVVVVDPATHLVKVCAWCVPLVRLMEIHRAYRCTDGICPDCRVKLEQEVA
jgi:hypothetical protein